MAKVKLTKPICPYCEKASVDGLTHIKCTRKLGLDGLVSIWEYEGVIRKAILALKYKYSLEVGSELSSVFLKYIAGSKYLVPDTVMLVPIPIHWYRENLRGFNQSNLLGRDIAEAREWKFEPNLLIKKKSTVSQVELTGEVRRQNLRGVFTLASSTPVPDSVLLFDDVFTTGSTLIEAAKVLKRAGVSKVWGLTVAR